MVKPPDFEDWNKKSGIIIFLFLVNITTSELSPD